MKILGITGSLRGGSYNRSLLRAALAEVPDGVEVMAFEGLGALPYFDEDLETAGVPAVVHFFRRAIAEADALLVVTPEYNGSTSGVLKNALDWASRGPDRVLAGKPVVVMGTSTGRGGAQGGIDAVVRILRRTRSEVLDRTVAVPSRPKRSMAIAPSLIRACRPRSRSSWASLWPRTRTEVPLAA